MQTTSAQKLGLTVIYSFLGIFIFFEKFGNFIYSAVLGGFRLFALFFIFGVFLSFSTKLIVKPGYLFESFFYFQQYPSAGLLIRQQLPRKVSQISMPVITAQGAIALDAKTGKVLYALNPDTAFPPASTTKVMTFLTAQDLYTSTQKLAIPHECTLLNSQRAGFVPQELVGVNDLYYALLINSAGDAACTLATYTPNFVTKMNEKTAVLGLKNTRFSNAVGFDNFEGHMSTPRDLAQLGLVAMKNDLARQIAKTKNLTLTSSGISHDLTNTNKLLWEIPETVGLKTGTTDGAGEVLIYMFEKNEKSIAIVVMKSSDRFGDTKKILDWVLQSYSWQI